MTIVSRRGGWMMVKPELLRSDYVGKNYQKEHAFQNYFWNSFIDRFGDER